MAAKCRYCDKPGGHFELCADHSDCWGEPGGPASLVAAADPALPALSERKQRATEEYTAKHPPGPEETGSEQ